MIARDVRESRCLQCNAIQATLLQSVTGGLKCEMAHGLGTQLGKNAMQFDRIRRRMTEDLGAPWRDDANSPEACGCKTQVGP